MRARFTRWTCDRCGHVVDSDDAWAPERPEGWTPLHAPHDQFTGGLACPACVASLIRWWEMGKPEMAAIFAHTAQGASEPVAWMEGKP